LRLSARKHGALAQLQRRLDALAQETDVGVYGGRAEGEYQRWPSVIKKVPQCGVAGLPAEWNMGRGHAAVAQAMEPATALDDVAVLHMSIGRDRWPEAFDVLDISARDV
jgi:hypothetical protein